MKEMGDALFAYGTLLEEARRIEVLGHGVEVIEARLDGFQRGRARYNYIVRADGAQTPGLIMVGLTEEDFRRLDAYEELPTLYTREKIEVATSDGMVRCWVYFPTAECLNP